MPQKQTCISLISAALVALALVFAGLPARAEEQQPLLVPMRDVDITFKVTRPGEQTFTERVRWSVNERLERIDGPHQSTSIFNRKANEVTLVNGETHTYRKLTRTYHKPQGVPRWPIEPERGAVLKRGADSVVAGQACTEWSWTEDAATHTVCGTPDGILLRLVVGGKTVIEASSVNYRQQPVEIFEVPADYAPALEPGP